MGDKGKAGVKNLKKLVTSLMNGPKLCGWTPPFYTFSDKKNLLGLYISIHTILLT